MRQTDWILYLFMFSHSHSRDVLIIGTIKTYGLYLKCIRVCTEDTAERDNWSLCGSTPTTILLCVCIYIYKCTQRLSCIHGNWELHWYPSFIQANKHCTSMKAQSCFLCRHPVFFFSFSGRACAWKHTDSNTFCGPIENAVWKFVGKSEHESFGLIYAGCTNSEAVTQLQPSWAIKVSPSFLSDELQTMTISVLHLVTMLRKQQTPLLFKPAGHSIRPFNHLCPL